MNKNFLIQSEDKKIFTKKDFKVVSKIKPSKTQFENLIFAFNVCRYVKSNAIVIASNKSTLGIGSGQPSRLDSCEIAIKKMKKFTKPSIDNISCGIRCFFSVYRWNRKVSSIRGKSCYTTFRINKR